MNQTANRQFLRHALAVVAYRGGKALRGAPESFAGFSACGRTPANILAHIGDLMDWALSICRGAEAWHNSDPQPWGREIARFHQSLKALDDYLASDAPINVELERLFQGPIADALTHVGQIAMMRRLASCAMKGENYFVAEIVAGRVGQDQAVPKREF